jgi:hypothetical protein
VIIADVVKNDLRLCVGISKELESLNLHEKEISISKSYPQCAALWSFVPVMAQTHTPDCFRAIFLFVLSCKQAMCTSSSLLFLRKKKANSNTCVVLKLAPVRCSLSKKTQFHFPSPIGEGGEAG